MKGELKFLTKVIRNAGILAGLMFVSMWASNTLTWILAKPIIIYFFTYVLLECAVRYKLNPKKVKTNINTLIL